MNIYGIYAMFIPYARDKLTSWLASDIPSIRKSIKECPLFCQGKLWIPSKFYPEFIIHIYLRILNSFQSGWRYCIRHYNTAEFGNSNAAQRVIIKIFSMSDIDSNLPGRYNTTHKERFHSGYEHCIWQELNSPMELYSVSLTKNVLTHFPASQLPAQMLPNIVASINANIKFEAQSKMLHLIYPGTETIPSRHVSGHHSIFGHRFGVHFSNKDNMMYGWPLSGEELLPCYSIPQDMFPDKAVLPRIDSITN